MYDIRDNKVVGVSHILFIFKEAIMRSLINDLYVTINQSSRWVDEFCQTVPYWNERFDGLDRMDTYGLDSEDADMDIGVLWAERLA